MHDSGTNLPLFKGVSGLEFTVFEVRVLSLEFPVSGF
jgi:hypothetical protein